MVSELNPNRGSWKNMYRENKHVLKLFVFLVFEKLRTLIATSIVNFKTSDFEWFSLSFDEWQLLLILLSYWFVWKVSATFEMIEELASMNSKEQLQVRIFSKNMKFRRANEVHSWHYCFITYDRLKYFSKSTCW